MNLLKVKIYLPLESRERNVIALRKGSSDPDAGQSKPGGLHPHVCGITQKDAAEKRDDDDNSQNYIEYQLAFVHSA